MATKFKEVSLDNVEQGEFLKNCEKAFRELQQDILRHVKTTRTNGLAVLSIKVGIKSNVSENGGSYAIITSIDKIQPKKPAVVTTALAPLNPADGECLFAAQSGTNADSPLQGQLCRENGNEIEPVEVE